MTETNVPNIQFYDLFHKTASLMLKLEVPVKVSHERRRYWDPVMILNIYPHMIHGLQNETAQNVGEITAIIKFDGLYKKVENRNVFQEDCRKY